jgi:hypothetical protein
MDMLFFIILLSLPNKLANQSLMIKDEDTTDKQTYQARAYSKMYGRGGSGLVFWLAEGKAFG